MKFTIASELKKLWPNTALGIVRYEAEVAAAFAQGNIGRAQEAASGDAFANLAHRTVQIIKDIDKLQIYEIVEVVKKIEDEGLQPMKANIHYFKEYYCVFVFVLFCVDPI